MPCEIRLRGCRPRCTVSSYELTDECNDASRWCAPATFANTAGIINNDKPLFIKCVTPSFTHGSCDIRKIQSLLKRTKGTFLYVRSDEKVHRVLYAAHTTFC